ncbi:hypothetical protein ACS0TY_006752 [Phlomoides rotata]
MLQENTLLSSYDEALEALSSLITKRMHADKSNSGDRFDLMFDYVKGGLPHRTFLLDELKVATNSFDNSALMGEGSTGKLKLYNENEDDEVNDHEMIGKERMKN